MPSIFIVDDHQIVVDGLEGLLSTEPELKVIGTASNGKEAIDAVRMLKPDLILMDIDMPVMNGLEASTQLLKEFPDLKIAILTQHAERAIVEQMMKIGVSGYFIKNADKLEFITGIRLILAGKTYFHAEAFLGFTQRSTLLTSGSSESLLLAQLSPREREVLKHIAEGMTSREIAQQLHISERTVETHRKHIHQKTEVKNLAGLIRFAIKAGLVS